jgi:predicted nuclease with TOPRIM domain
MITLMKKKKHYHAKLDSQLEEWDSRIDLLALALKRQKADGKVQCEEQIKKLRQEQAALQEKVAKLKQTRGKTWVDLKSSVEKGALEFKASLDKALLRYV